MQKLGTGLLISRMIVDGPRVFCERMDGSWQSGTEREAPSLALDTVECSDTVRALLEDALRAVAQRRASPASAPTVGEDEMATLMRQLSPDIKDELLGLLRLRVGAGTDPATTEEEPSLGYVYTDPETGAKRWVPSDRRDPPESSAAHPCPHCQKVWSSERALHTHARQCADNPASTNFKGLAEDDPAEEGGASWLSSQPLKNELA